MRRSSLPILGLGLLTAFPLLADFSYQQTSNITGGMMASMLKVAGVFSKQAREPIQATVAVKGNRMVHKSANTSSIIDLDSETITNIDMQKKTYTVMTFAQMKQMLEDAQQKMAQHKKDEPEIKFKVSAKDTGKTKPIAGMDAKEMILKMEMEGTDAKSQQQGSMVITTDMWIAPAASGYKEVREFSRKMAQKLNWSPDGGLFAVRPDVSQGMAEVAKEIAKLDGMPVYQTVVMGGPGSGDAIASGNAPAPDKPKEQAARPSLGGALGGALGGKFGLGKKKDPPPPAEEQSGNGSQAAAGTLLEMTTEMSGFSSAPVDGSLFEVPAGFKKVEMKNAK